jgi:hypothetical protein
LARELAKEKIKQLIDALREKPATWSDLKEIAGLPDKSLDRYLEYLKYWGLARKIKSGYWDWFERIRLDETEHGYNLAINHSKKLLDVLVSVFPLSVVHPDWFKKQETVLDQPQRDLKDLSDMVEQHLKTGYPQIYAEIVAFKNLVAQETEMAESLQAYRPKIAGDQLVEYLGTLRLIPAKYAIPKKYRKEVERIANSITQEQLVSLEKISEKHQEGVIKISKELRGLQLKVEHGDPLQGMCEFCPKARIKQTEPRARQAEKDQSATTQRHRGWWRPQDGSDKTHKNGRESGKFP